MEESFRLDFLESLTLHEAKGKLHLTVFVRSIPVGHHLAIRTSIPIPEERTWIEFSSIARVWPQAASFESELSPLFGMRFVGGEPSVSVHKDFGTFNGFPMRKSFTWGRDLLP
jgi:NADH:ubiquinone oxidoreductase subunit C